MNWAIEETEINPQIVYDILKNHKLLPESTPMAASACNSIGSSGARFSITEDEELRCEVFVSEIIPGETASLDLVPVASYFRHGYHEAFSEVMTPLIEHLFSEMGVRRISAAIPASRSRTKRALCSLGFAVEGRLREAVKLHNEEPQDLRILGLLKSDQPAGE
jgi:hypothetical protein